MEAPRPEAAILRAHRSHATASRTGARTRSGFLLHDSLIAMGGMQPRRISVPLASLRYPASMNLRRAPMRFWLPMLSLMLWVVLVSVPVTLVYTNLMSEARGAPTVTLRAGSTTLMLRRDQFFDDALLLRHVEPRRDHRGDQSSASFIQLLLASLFHSWPGSWAPAGLDFRSWRAISFPIFCLPFWWFEGLGLDGLLTRKHSHWRTFLLGTLFWGLFLTGLLAIQSGMSAEERTEMIYPICGFGPRALLLSVFPVGWIIRWRNRRRRSPSC